jgi:hypothetical protein
MLFLKYLSAKIAHFLGNTKSFEGKIERLLKFTNKPNDPGVYRYVMKPEMYSTLTQAKVIKEAALRSGVSQEVKRVTSTSGEVEDPENENGGGTTEPNTPSGGNGGGTGGGGNSDPSDGPNGD